METLYGLISLLNIPITNPVLEFIYNEVFFILLGWVTINIQFVSYFFLMVCLNAITLPLLSKAMREEMVWWKRNVVDPAGEKSTTAKASLTRVHHK